MTIWLTPVPALLTTWVTLIQGYDQGYGPDLLNPLMDTAERVERMLWPKDPDHTSLATVLFHSAGWKRLQRTLLTDHSASKGVNQMTRGPSFAGAR